jgi:hypothetical protein
MRVPIQAGQIYKHANGTHYVVTKVTTDSETLEGRVVYKNVGKILDLNEPEWDRPARMWAEPVLWPDGIMRPRFILHA